MSWIEDAERAVERGSSDDATGVRVLVGRRPPMLDAFGMKAVAAPFVAAIIGSAAVFLEMINETSIDPGALLLRALALGFTFRTVFLLSQLSQRWSAFSKSSAYRLGIHEEGLFFRTPIGDVVTPKTDVLGVLERDGRQPRGRGRSWRDVFVAVAPGSGRTHLTLPPVFDGSPALLADRLKTWLSEPEPDPQETTPAADAVASEVWEAAVKGTAPEGGAILKHGLEWLRDGPVAVLVIAIVTIEGLLRAGPEAWALIDPLIGGALGLVLIAIPARWLFTTRREVSPRSGVAMVISRDESFIKMRYGMIRTPHAELAQVSTDAKRKWSLLEGSHLVRVLLMVRAGTDPIRYDELLLGVPVEVGQLLLDAYRRGRLPEENRG